MDWNNDTALFLTGAIFGLVVAAVGAAIEFRLHLARNVPRRRPLPSCLFYVAAGLGLAGLVAIILSWLITGGVRLALLVGAGVLAGFYAGFLLLLGVWLYFDARHSS